MILKAEIEEKIPIYKGMYFCSNQRVSLELSKVWVLISNGALYGRLVSHPEYIQLPNLNSSEKVKEEVCVCA